MADKTIPSLDTASSLDYANYLIVEQSSGGTKKTNLTALSNFLLGTSGIASLGGDSVKNAIYRIHAVINAGNSGAHNAIYRGTKQGESSSDVPWSTISSGAFSNLFIGDYWTINDVNWRIAAFDYYRNTGNTVNLSKHHIVIVPDTCIGAAVAMNDAASTAGGYKGSKMFTERLASALQAAEDAFKVGNTSHILPVEHFLTSSVSDGTATGVSTATIKMWLMSERNVFGSVFQANEKTGTLERGQYPLFFYRPELIRWENKAWHLQNVVSATEFARVSATGSPGKLTANSTAYIRPAFCIYSD